MRLINRALVLAVLAVPAATAGIITPVLTLPGLSATGSIDWGQLGTDLTVLTGPVNQALTSSTALTGTLTSPNDVWAVQQGNTWGGNFTTGDNVVYSTLGILTVSFSAPIKGAGMQFQPGSLGGFTASLTAFGAGNTNFGTVTLAGTSSNAADGSAIFLGFLSDLTDVTKITINVQIASADTDFAVNSLSFNDSLTSSGSIPEPSTILLGFAGLLGIAVMRRRP